MERTQRTPGRILFVALSLAGLGRELHAQNPATPRALKEELRIEDKGANWTRITSLAVSRSGALALAFGSEIRFFSATGAPSGTFGRKGEGPGEFWSISLMTWSAADTLVVTDYSYRRLTIIGPDRRLVTTKVFDTRTAKGVNDSSFMGGFSPLLTPVAANANTLTLLRGWPMGTHGMNGVPLRRDLRDAEAVIAPTGATGAGRVVAWFPHDDCEVAVKTEQMSSRRAIAFCQAPLTTFHPTTGNVTMASSATPLRPHSEYRLVTIRLSGDTVLNRRIPFTPTLLPKDSAVRQMTVSGKAIGEFQAKLARGNVTEAAPGEAYAAAYVAAARTAGIPQQHPQVRDLLVAESGAIWIEVFDKGSAHLWEIRSATGDLQERVSVPANVTLKAVSAKGVWGLALDADGVESIVRYAVR